MYEEHPIFVQPENEDIKVWRYMDFTKFVSFIESRSLYFARADRLGDPFEGSLPRLNVDAREEIQKRVTLPPDIPQHVREQYLNQLAATGDINQYWLRFYAINCWHMNEYESAAMWKLYLKSNEGLAIQSTYRKLRDSIVDNERVFLGEVKYIDYEKEAIGHYYDINAANPSVYNPFSTFVHKRKSFEHEREVRALIWRPPTEPEGQVGKYKDTIDNGVYIKADIGLLVERIFVAPSAPVWFSELVNTIANRLGFAFEVVPSKLDDRPIF